MGETRSNSNKPAVFGLILCAAAFLLIFFAIPGDGPSGWDRRAGDWIAGTESAAWTKAMQGLAFLGSSSAILVLTLLLTAAAARFTGLRKALWMVAGTAAAYAVNTALKAWIARPRPADAWGIEADGFSFPSGNAMLAVVLYGMFAIWMGKYGGIGTAARNVIVGAAVLLIVLIGWSRLYFSVHYVTDIAAGYAAGGLIVFLLLLAEGKFGKSR